MASTTISDAVVWPQDDGTGVADGSEDYSSAGYLGLLAQATDQEYKVGLGLSSLDTTNETVDVASGHCYILEAGNTVQSGAQTSYDTTLPSSMVYLVVFPTSTTVDLDADTDANLEVVIDPSSQDSVTVQHNTSPTNPSLVIGSADSTGGGNGTSESNTGQLPSSYLTQTSESRLSGEIVHPVASGNTWSDGQIPKYNSTSGFLEPASDATASGGSDVADLASNGLLVYGSLGTGRQTIDPASTTTPIQDAVTDLEVNGNTNDGRKIWLPPGEVSEVGPITHTESITIQGFNKGSWNGSARGSSIKFTGDNANGVSIDTQSVNYLDVAFDGNRSNRTLAGTERLVSFESSSGTQCVFDRCRFFNHYGEVAHFDFSGFETYWGTIKIDNVDAGDAGGIFDGSTGAPMVMENIGVYPDKAISGLYSDIISIVSTNLVIGNLNIGGTPRLIFDSWAGRIHASMINWEPAAGEKTGASNALPNGALCELGALGTTIQFLQIYGADSSPDHAYRLRQDNSNRLGDMYLTSPATEPRNDGGTGSDSSFDAEIVEVIDDIGSTDGGPVIYEGESSDVLNNSGGTLTKPVSCLGDLTTVT